MPNFFEICGFEDEYFVTRYNKYSY